MRVLITGGAGYLGSTIAEVLLSNGHEVTILDNFLYGVNSVFPLIKYEKCHIIKGDVRDERILQEAIKKMDVILPLAAIVGAPACDMKEIESKQVNELAIASILKYRSMEQYVAYPCTNSGYGSGVSAQVYNEESPLNPISTYGVQKVEAEKMILNSKNTLSIRLATVFGVGNRVRLDLLVNDLTYRAWDTGVLNIFEGHFSRNYVHVRDVANAFLAFVENSKFYNSGAYNFGNSLANMTKLELAELIKIRIPNLTINQIENKADPDKRNYIVDNSKLEAKGVSAVIPVDVGIGEILKIAPLLRRSPYNNL
jgi:nucleoside-diphosphate-sugar epimerase